MSEMLTNTAYHQSFDDMHGHVRVDGRQDITENETAQARLMPTVIKSKADD